MEQRNKNKTNYMNIKMEQKTKKQLYVIIDNGHGTREYTKGKFSPDKSLYEGEWNRMFAKKLAEALSRQNIVTQLLVTEDKDIKLKERVKRANDIYAEKRDEYEVILISIHINGAGNEGKWMNASGFTVWVSSNAGTKSKKLGKAIGLEATHSGLRGNRYIPFEQYHVKGYTIIHDTKMPAVLCENMFMDNKEDLAFLKTESGVDKLLGIYTKALKNIEL